METMNMTNNKFAAHVGVSKSIMSRILNGVCEPNIETLRKIAEATNTSPEWILGYGPDDPRPPLNK